MKSRNRTMDFKTGLAASWEWNCSTTSDVRYCS
jgi:hypothetical protein